MKATDFINNLSVVKLFQIKLFLEPNKILLNFEKPRCLIFCQNPLFNILSKYITFF